MDTNGKLRQLLSDIGWSEYRLAKNSGLSESTIANIYRRNTVPSITTLEAICKSFGITLSQFFAENEMIELTPEVKELLNFWMPLTVKQKEAVLYMLQVMNPKLHFYSKRAH
jgi:transcriptional regulator with XRE-family HTH domain